MRYLTVVLLLVPILAFGIVEHRRANAISAKLDELGGQLGRLAARPAPVAAPVICPTVAGGTITVQAPPALPAQPAATPPTRTRTEAIAQAHDQLESVLSRRRLSQDDVLSLRTSLAGADSEEAQEIRRRIAAAINTRELVPEDPHFIMP